MFGAGMEDVFTKPLSEQKAIEVLKEYAAVVVGDKDSVVLDSLPAKIIDLESSKRLLGYTDETAREMLGMFMKTLPEAQRQIQEAYQNSDMEALEFQVHKFHGGTYYCGVPRLKVAAEQVELALKAKDRKANDVNILYGVLLKEMKALAEEFEKLNSGFSG